MDLEFNGQKWVPQQQQQYTSNNNNNVGPDPVYYPGNYSGYTSHNAQYASQHPIRRPACYPLDQNAVQQFPPQQSMQYPASGAYTAQGPVAGNIGQNLTLFRPAAEATYLSQHAGHGANGFMGPHYHQAGDFHRPPFQYYPPTANAVQQGHNVFASHPMVPPAAGGYSSTTPIVNNVGQNSVMEAYPPPCVPTGRPLDPTEDSDKRRQGDLWYTVPPAAGGYSSTTPIVNNVGQNSVMEAYPPPCVPTGRSLDPTEDSDKRRQGDLRYTEKVDKFQWGSGASCFTFLDGERLKAKIVMLHKDQPSATLKLTAAPQLVRKIGEIYPLHHFYNDSEGTTNENIPWKTGDVCFAKGKEGIKKGWIQAVSGRFAEVACENAENVTELFLLENIFQPHLYDKEWKRYKKNYDQLKENEGRLGCWKEVGVCESTTAGVSEPKSIGNRAQRRARRREYLLKASTSFEEKVFREGRYITYQREVVVSCLPGQLPSLINFFGLSFPTIISRPEFRLRELNIFDDCLGVQCGSLQCDGTGDNCRCTGGQMAEFKKSLCECFKHIRCEPNLNMLEPLHWGIDTSKQVMLLAYLVAALVKQDSGDKEEASHLLTKAFWYHRKVTELCSVRRSVGAGTGCENWDRFAGSSVIEIAKNCVALRYLDDISQFSVDRSEERSVGIPSRKKMKIISLYLKPKPNDTEDLQTAEFVLLKTLLLDAYLEAHPRDLNGLVRDYCEDYSQ